MKVLIAGGTGFLGSALGRSLVASGHEVCVLTRRVPRTPQQIQWDGQTAGSWAGRINEMDAVVHATGYGLEHWPWTASHKRRFQDSRILPGMALMAAVEAAQ